ESREAYGIEAVALGNVIACGLQRPQLAYRWCHPQSARIERTGARRVTRSVGCTRHHGVTHRVSRGILETEDALLEAGSRHDAVQENRLIAAATFVIDEKVALPLIGEHVSAEAAAKAVIHHIWLRTAQSVCVPPIGVQH